MKYVFKPKTDLEKFGLRTYSALVENFPKTYFVGGMLRDALLKRKIGDIDIATAAKPGEVVEVLKKYFIAYNIGFIYLGVVIALERRLACAIATFRKDLATHGRYPEVQFVAMPKEDAKRRDFTVNALYLSVKSKKILDFYTGIKDLKNREIKFIGNAEKKIKEDPLRIIRALRFALQLQFRLSKTAKAAIISNLRLVNLLTKSKLKKEVDKLENERSKNLVYSAIKNRKILTNNF
ncbi:MAG: CCA tRNA nucleotidyltransferase [Candidatus Doudnabacteria bacterium]|nr:CCA tRNA nucleotidyltransferase [Candidatus Doudnabacteria bacterium]